jgi:hypothetical protein
MRYIFLPKPFENITVENIKKMGREGKRRLRTAIEPNKGSSDEHPAKYGGFVYRWCNCTEQTLSRKSSDGSHHPATDKQRWFTPR